MEIVFFLLYIYIYIYIYFPLQMCYFFNHFIRDGGVSRGIAHRVVLFQQQYPLEKNFSFFLGLFYLFLHGFFFEFMAALHAHNNDKHQSNYHGSSYLSTQAYPDHQNLSSPLMLIKLVVSSLGGPISVCMNYPLVIQFLPLLNLYSKHPRSRASVTNTLQVGFLLSWKPGYCSLYSMTMILISVYFFVESS